MKNEIENDEKEEKKNVRTKKPNQKKTVKFKITQFIRSIKQSIDSIESFVFAVFLLLFFALWFDYKLRKEKNKSTKSTTAEK